MDLELAEGQRIGLRVDGRYYELVVVEPRRRTYAWQGNGDIIPTGKAMPVLDMRERGDAT